MKTPAIFDDKGVTVTAGKVKCGPWTVAVPRGTKVAVRECWRSIGAELSTTPAGRAVERVGNTVVGCGWLAWALQLVLKGNGTVPEALGAVALVPLGLFWLYHTWVPSAAWVVEVTTPSGTQELRLYRTPAEAETLRAAVERAIAEAG